MLAALLLLLPTACVSSSHNQSAPTLEKSQHSDLLRIEKQGSCNIVEILDPRDSLKVFSRYILIPERASKAEEDSLKDVYPEAIVLHTPMRNMLIYSSVQGKAFIELKFPEAIGGIVDSQYFNVEGLNQRVKSGEIVDCGSASMPSVEKILAMKPSAILLSLYEGMDVNGIEGLGIPIIRLQDNLEPTPLGRAEWLRFLGALVGKEDTADCIFEQVCTDYQNVKKEASTLKKRPKVLTDIIYEGVWYVPAGESYAAQIFADAGGDYPWSATKGSGSLACSFEEILAKAQDADVWVFRVFNRDESTTSMLSQDDRYQYFNSFKKGDVWYANSAKVAVFEDCNYHPERLLRDYSRIFRATADGYEPDSLTYFKRIAR